MAEGRILGLDYGRKRLGVAVSDPLRITAQALPTISVKTWSQVLSEINSIAQNYSVTQIIVGMPLHLKGIKGTIAKEVDKFVTELEALTRIPVKTWDERWTSVLAEQAIVEMGKSPSRNKGKIDQIAAQLILQSYLDYIGT